MRCSWFAVALIFLPLVCCFALPVCGAESGSKTKLKLVAIEDRLLKETNVQRVRYGLPPLKLDPALEKSARQQASWMCATGNFSHTSQMVGENIALGQTTVQEAMTDWMNSPGHRANILSSDYSRIGVAAYQIGENGEIYWCQQFLR